MSWRLLAIIARLGIGLVLFYASLSLVIALLHSREIQQALIAVGMLLGCLWWLWSKLPDWFQDLIRALWKRKENKNDQD